MDTFSKSVHLGKCLFCLQFSLPRGPFSDSELSAQQVDALFLSSFLFSQQHSGPLYVENMQTFQALNTSVTNIYYLGHLKDLLK